MISRNTLLNTHGYTFMLRVMIDVFSPYSGKSDFSKRRRKEVSFRFVNH